MNGNGLLDGEMELASVDWFLKWGQTCLFLFLAMIRGWCTQMEAKDTEKGRHVVVFIALSITWPSILYLFIFQCMKERVFGLTSSLRRCGQVSSTLPTPFSLWRIKIFYCTLPCIIGIPSTPFCPPPYSIASMVLRTPCSIISNEVQNKIALERMENWKQNLWKIWSASYPNGKPESLVSLKETGLAVLTPSQYIKQQCNWSSTMIFCIQPRNKQ